MGGACYSTTFNGTTFPSTPNEALTFAHWLRYIGVKMVMVA